MSPIPDRSEEGPYGTAAELPVKDTPEYSETVCHWLITGTRFHPFWTQWTLVVVRLREVEGRPPIRYQFEGATHELLVIALNPEYGDKDILLPNGSPAKQWSGPSAFTEFTERKGLPYLTPIDVCIQFEATDDEMTELAGYACKAVVAGQLSPDQDFREGWKVSLVKTLAHIRGEEHAR